MRVHINYMSSPKVSPEVQSQLISSALDEARAAFTRDEVPVGAVVAKLENGTLHILSRAGNRVEEQRCASAHAEHIAIQSASALLGNWRLEGCILAVTLEPCTMCAGLIRAARIPLIIYGASDPTLGAFGSLYDLSQDGRLGKVPRVISGVEERACSEILSEFFSKKRAQQSKI